MTALSREARNLDVLTVDDLTFEVLRSARRTVGITVERDQRLSLHLPEGLPLERAREVVQRKRLWIYQKLAQKRRQAPLEAPKPLLVGQGFYYLGRSHRLRLSSETQGAALRLERGRFVLREDQLAKGREHFIAWYKAHLRPRLEREVAELAPRLEVVPGKLIVMELGYRWGSCSPNGGLNFHWRVAMLPARVVRYLVAHELVHLLEPNHDERFWRRLERVVPHSLELRRWLAEQGGKYNI